MKYLLSLLFALYLPMNSLALASLDEVSLRDKIGQMLLMGFDGKKVDDDSPIVQAIQKNNLGGVILFDYDSRRKVFDKNIESPEQVKQLNQALQSFSEQGQLAHHRPNLPLFISVDYEGGQVVRLREQYGFPKTPSAGAVGKGTLEASEEVAESMSQTLKEAGFNLNFAPVLDVNVNPDSPAIGRKERSFSASPIEVAQFGGVYSKHFVNQNIQCAYKHFPGYGSSAIDPHVGFTDVSDTWQQTELEPYERLLNQEGGCKMVMTAHIVNRQLDDSGLPATLSHKILTDLLRNQLHFNGVIITDDMQMGAITSQYGLENALVLTINAGADMLIFGNNLLVSPIASDDLINIIEAKVTSGEIKKERIDDAYEHIVHLKQSLM